MLELPNIVPERLRASQPASAHPDADVLTAFAERSLPESERTVVVEHLACCHDCRDILALSLPATAASETVPGSLPVDQGTARNWLRTPVLRWGVVAAGFAVLTVTGILQYQGRRQASFTVAKQTNSALPQALPVPVSRNEDSAKPSPGTPKASAGSAAGFSNASASAGPAGASDDAVANGRSAATSVREPGVSEPPAPSPSGALTNSTLAAPRPASGSIGGPIKQDSFPQRTAPPSQTLESSAAAPMVAGSTADQVAVTPLQYEAKVQPGDQSHGNANQRSLFDAPVDKAKAPTVSQNYAGVPAAQAFAPRWAVSTTGSLLRSLDQGRTWAIVDTTMSQSQPVQSQNQIQALNRTQVAHVQEGLQKDLQNNDVQRDVKKVSPPANSTPVFRALSAAGSQVWAGGTAGMLFHSADGGQQWTRVFLMTSGVPSTGDIVGITFPDPQHGQITTSTQELWITLDAGQTWQKR